MTTRIECLARNRDAIDDYMKAVNEATAQHGTTSAA
jgi:hypothetical protein